MGVALRGPSFTLGVMVLATACATPVGEDTTEQFVLTAAQKRTRLELIRDAAAEMGVTNAALIGGIAVSETNLAHCWSEATYACMGPASSSCNGGPVIAGAADGPCADMQGGLGLFQFDAGTYAQTLATYTPAVLTVEGNTAQAVAFVVGRLQQSITGVDDWMTAVGYLNTVPLMAGDPTTEEWAQFLACRYNGCCSNTTTCNTRAANYRDNAIDLYAEMGADFWRTSTRCAGIPDDGMIDDRSACYLAGGEPRYWRRETTGANGTSEWTSSTAAASPANFARWHLRPPAPTKVALEVHVQGGTATAASYRIVHGGVTDTVVIDQTTADGLVMLGEYELLGTGDEYVELGDNTGTSGQRLVYDALKVTSLDGTPFGDEVPPPAGDDGGCASGGGSARGLAWVALALVGLRRRRRRR